MSNNEIYSATQFIKDKEFAEELLKRMGLRDFKVLYKPSNNDSFLWTYWNKKLDSYDIESNFEQLQKFNKKLKLVWGNFEVEEEFDYYLNNIYEVLSWLHGLGNYSEQDVIELFNYMCPYSHIVVRFNSWLKERE